MSSYLSKYAKQLQNKEQQRYIDKIKEFKRDPYTLQYNEQELPKNISSIEINEYLVHKKSFYTTKEFKAFKSLAAYRLYIGGWVQNLGRIKINRSFVVLGRVLHSQSLNAKPLFAWVYIKDDATIIAAHCDCVAGLGECCTHVGAVLFALNALHSNLLEKEPKSVTDVKVYWVVPIYKKALQLCNENIDYNCGKKGANSEEHVEKVIVSTRGDMMDVMQKIAANGMLSTMMLGLDDFTSNDRTDIETQMLIHMYFANFYNVGNETEDLEVLRSKFDQFKFTISEEQATTVENVTRNKCSCSYWHKLRLGRITASTFKAVCRANTSFSFPVSLLKDICYPNNSLNTAAIVYGKKNEPIALKNLYKVNKKLHSKYKNFLLWLVHREGKIFLCCLARRYLAM